LAEALLSQKNGGSLAMIAPTSLTFQSYQSILVNQFLALLLLMSYNLTRIKD